MRPGLVLLVGLAGCEPVGPVGPDTPVAESVLPTRALAEAVVHNLTIYGMFQLTEEPDAPRSWSLSFYIGDFDTTTFFAPNLAREGCVLWSLRYPGEYIVGDSPKLDEVVEVGGDESSGFKFGLDPIAGMSFFVGSGRGAEMGDTILLLPDVFLGTVPARPEGITLRTIAPNATLGEAWQEARWTPRDDGSRLQIEIGDQVSGSTMVCQADDDGYALLPMVPDDVLWQFHASWVQNVDFTWDDGPALVFVQSEIGTPARVE